MRMSASDFLHDQLNLYRAQAGAVASLPPPTETSERRKLEDTIALGVSIFDSILQRKHQLVANGELSKLLAVLPQAADSLLTQWETWLVSTRPLVATVDAWESAGVRVGRSSALRKAYTIARLEDFDRQQLIEAAKAAIEGRFKPLREAADEFRRRRFGSRS
jgi:PHD/YefM family antitoxin component YafN of YafNO toxin-antitoxin module